MKKFPDTANRRIREINLQIIVTVVMILKL